MTSGEIVVDGTFLDGRSRRLDPRAQTEWMLMRSVPWLVLGAVGGVVGVVNDMFALVVATLIAMVVAVAIAVTSAVLSYRYWSWVAHDDALEISRGVIVRHISVVPYHRIQQIDIDRGPLERILGIATLVLRSAAATSDARLPGIALAYTEPLRQELLARAGSGDAV